MSKSPNKTQYYTNNNIVEDCYNAKYWNIVAPGWHAWDGPEGDEWVSGPFETEELARTNFTRWVDSITLYIDKGELKGNWTLEIIPNRWNWSHYLGWFLSPEHKGILGLIDRLREIVANRGTLIPESEETNIWL